MRVAQLDRAYKKIEELEGNSEEKPMEPELKELPEHSKYVFLSQGTPQLLVLLCQKLKKKSCY